MSGLWPQVQRRWLFAIAAAFWAIAGSMLLGWTVVWLSQVAVLEEWVLAHLGAVAALIAARLIFLRVVRTNIRRLDAGPDRAWALAFQTWKSYLVMAFMIALGVVLRMSASPRLVLAVLYEAIGGGLLLGAYLYLHHFMRPDDTPPEGD